MESKRTKLKPDKEAIFNNIKAGLEEVRLFKKGELRTTSTRDFLTEL